MISLPEAKIEAAEPCSLDDFTQPCDPMNLQILDLK
jgi:hypothetical protein